MGWRSSCVFGFQGLAEADCGGTAALDAGELLSRQDQPEWLAGG